MQTTTFGRNPFLFLVCLFFSSPIFGQVTANFSTSTTSGCGLVQTSFTDLSSTTAGSLSSWSWDFDGGTSSLQNPGRTFSTPGKYTICLTVTNSEGDSDTACKSDLIEVFTLPVPEFSADETKGCVPHEVTFSSSSTSSSPIASYIWGVGGQSGVISSTNGDPVVNQYPNADSYTISLTIKDENGCTNSISKGGYIEVFDNPTIQVTPSSTFSCDPPMVVNFTNDNIEAETTYNWNFGNGQTFQGAQPPAVQYNQSGTYSVTVSAVNEAAGCNSEEVFTDLIEVGHPIVVSSDVQSICLGESVSFTDASLNPAQSITWDFGDGNTSTDANPSHTYGTDGCFAVSIIRVVDGCSTTASLDYCIEVKPRPTGMFTIGNDIACSIPHTTGFDATISPGATVEWDFGDGTTSNSIDPNHTYSAYGTYNVNLTVTSSLGCSEIIPVQTVNIQKTNASISFTDFRGCSPLNFPLTDNSTSIVPIVAWEWNILDNSATPPMIYSSTEKNPMVSIADTGVFDVQLKVTNSLGCSDTKIFDRKIYVGVTPNTNFTISKDSACREESLGFFDGSSSFADEWAWSFGDGTVSYEQNPEHSYTGIGPFDVQLISFNNGCADTLEVVDALEILPPLARFETVLTCDNSNFRTFTNTSSGAETVKWDFGVMSSDTDTSTSETPSFTFPNPGSYITTLVTENSITGCSDTTTQEIIVTNLIPEIKIQDSIGCAPFNLNVLNSSNDAVTYTWTAPGGTIGSANSADPGIVYQDGGTFTNVELIVEDVNGCIEKMMLNTAIQVSKITPDLLPSTIAGCAGIPVDFTNQSTSTFNNIIASNWVVGNNLATFSTSDISYTFSEAGDFPISLTVEDDGGCIGTLNYSDLINIKDPKADYSTDAYSCTFAPLNIAGTAIGEGLNYSWSFGDGATSLDSNPIHQYAAEGQYEICVEVTDANGCVSDTCGVEQVIVLNPQANFSVDNAYGACPPLIANFHNTSVNSVNYEWNFGDNSGTSDLETPPHVFTDPGVFDVTLVAYTSEACTDTITLVDYIQLDGPVGDFSFTIDNTCAPSPVTFVANSLDSYDYYWDFGDGNIDTTLNVSKDSLVYNYESIGSYKPKLILVDNVNCQRIVELPDSITLDGFNYDFEAAENLHCGDEPLTTLMFLDGETSAPFQEILWELPGSNSPTSGTQSPIVTYNTPGTYDVQVVLDNGACRDTILKENYIKIGSIPTAAMAVDEDKGCYPHVVNFTDGSNIATGTITEWMWDFGNNNTATVENPIFTFEEIGETNVSLTVTSEIGCEHRIEQNIEVFALPTAEVAGETNICIGEVAQLQGTVLSGAPGGGVAWTGGPVNCADCNDTEVTPSISTIYTFTVTDGNSCTTQETYEVNVRSVFAPAIELGKDTSICLASSILLDLQIDQSGTQIAWDESIEGLSCYQNCPNPLASPTEATTYYVQVENVDGCKSLDSITISLIDDRQPFLADEEIICIGDSIEISVSMGADPVWENNLMLTCLDCPTTTVFPKSETMFTATVTSANGCRIQDSINIAVQEPQPIEAGEDLLACIGAGTEFTATGVGIPTWSPATGITNVNDLTSHVQPTETTTYRLILDDGVCTNMDSVTVEVIETTEVFASGAEICEGEEVIIKAEGLADDFTWESNGAIVHTAAELVAAPTSTTSYQLIGKMAGCEPDTAFIDVMVNEIPAGDYKKSHVILPEYAAHLKPTIDNIDNLEFTWTPAESLSCASCPDPRANPTDNTVYKVDIFNPVTGCTKTEEIEVRLRTKCGPDLIVTPNVFSPDNDGKNDEFKILYSPIQKISSFRIFDRWGQLLFETDEITAGWNGVFKGKKMPAGVYVYMIEATCPIDGSLFLKKGDVTIMR